MFNLSDFISQDALYPTGPDHLATNLTTMPHFIVTGELTFGGCYFCGRAIFTYRLLTLATVSYRSHHTEAVQQSNRVSQSNEFSFRLSEEGCHVFS